MSTADILENIRHKALNDPAFRHAILKTKSSKEPISDFCKLCRENGFELYEMELITFGEAEYAAMVAAYDVSGELGLQDKNEEKKLIGVLITMILISMMSDISNNLEILWPLTAEPHP